MRRLLRISAGPAGAQSGLPRLCRRHAVSWAVPDVSGRDYGDVEDDPGVVGDGDGDDTSREAMFINPGENYVLRMDLDAAGGNTGNDCGIDNQNINDEITLWIHIQGGGSTYETLTIVDKTFGADLV